MDPVSHAVLGAAAAQSTALTSRMRAVALAATVGSVAPDLDVLIRSSGDPVRTSIASGAGMCVWHRPR